MRLSASSVFLAGIPTAFVCSACLYFVCRRKRIASSLRRKSAQLDVRPATAVDIAWLVTIDPSAAGFLAAERDALRQLYVLPDARVGVLAAASLLVEPKCLRAGSSAVSPESRTLFICSQTERRPAFGP